jgi:arsenate reductase
VSLDIELLVTPDCPNRDPALGRLRETAARLAPEATIRQTVVSDVAQAEALDFPGSPTIRVDGMDLEGREVGPAALACRTYLGGGVPPEWLIEAGLLRALAPRTVLFMCVANSARSQMAEGVARSLAPAGVEIYSAGSEPSQVNPFALRALAEIGIDGSGQRSKGTDDIDFEVEAVITLCAEEVCPAWLGTALRSHWPLPDPAAAMGSDEDVLSSFRSVRREIERRLAVLFASPARSAAGPDAP